MYCSSCWPTLARIAIDAGVLGLLGGHCSSATCLHMALDATLMQYNGDIWD
jgi:hypothetical protein